MRLVQEYTADIEHRFKYAMIAVVLLFLVVAGRLYYLQVIRGDFYRFFSTENSIKATKIPAVRGMIFDRRGQVLVDNRASFNLVVVPQYVSDPERMMQSVTALMSVPRATLEEAWAKRKGQPSYQPLVLKKDVTMEEAAIVRSHKVPWNNPSDPYELRGVDVEANYERGYPDADIATHVLGYVREADAARLAELNEKSPGRYRPGAQVGIRGVEELWDEMLRGEDGYEERIVDAVGREVDYEGIASQLTNQESVAGASLRLTIDRDLQALGRELFGKRRGAAVLIDPRNGAILGMVSAPTYDLNRLEGPGGGEYWNELAASPDKPLLNRAIQGGYPPGSTFKIPTSIGALSEGVVKPDERVSCGGALVYGGRPYHCFSRGGHGPIDIHRAIVSSCDVFFYTMGLRLGVDRMSKYANLMGLGHKTGVPLPGEREGLIPTQAWKEKRLGTPWQRGEDLSVAVGQGYDVVVPIQNALVAAHVANGGQDIELHLVDAAYDVEANEIYRWKPSRELKPLPIDPKVLEIVKAGMVGVVAEPGGTGRRLSSYKVTMGGKTGTAQVYQLDSGVSCRSEACRDHAWFIGFSPADRPEIAGAVVVEHGGFGAAAAAPILGALFQKYHDIEHGEEEQAEALIKGKGGKKAEVKAKAEAEAKAKAAVEKEVREERRVEGEIEADAKASERESRIEPDVQDQSYEGGGE
jgi:penicillin-binding protein 2